MCKTSQNNSAFYVLSNSAALETLFVLKQETRDNNNIIQKNIIN